MTMRAAPHPLFRAGVRAVAAAFLAAALGLLAWRALLPDGRLSVTTDFADPAPYVSEPKPSDRLAATERAADGSARTPVVGTPVFVDLTPPSRFDSVTLTLAYENGGQAALEVGALVSALDGQFDVRPVESRLIDRVQWRRVTSGSVTLLDRHGRYAFVDEFFRDPPPASRVASYGIDPALRFRIEGYRPSGAAREIDVSLRGHHRLFTYVKDEPLNLTFTVQDMNRQLGADPVTVSVYREGVTEPVARTVLPDDGNALDDQRSSKLRQIPVSLTAPAEGAYKIEFTAPADVFIRKIVTQQRKLVFAEKVYLGDHVGYSDAVLPATVLTDGTRLTARTPHAETVQTLTVAGSRMALEQPNLKYVRGLSGAGLTPVTSPKRSVLLESDGVFAFSEDAYFDPQPLRLGWHVTEADLDARGIDFILAKYEPPRTEDGLRVATVSFDAHRLAKTESGAYRFVLSAPGIDETLQPLRLASLTFSLRRQPVTFRDALPRLFGAFFPAEESVSGVVSDGTTYGENPE